MEKRLTSTTGFAIMVSQGKGTADNKATEKNFKKVEKSC